MVTKKISKNVETDDQKTAIKVELKARIENSQVMLVGAIGETYSFNTRQVQALCTDIEEYKRILVALEDVKIV